MKFRGTVMREEVGRGTKSQHVATLLRTASGDYLLRREGGNAFRDETLDSLVGSEIECEGDLAVNTVIMRRWNVV